MAESSRNKVTRTARLRWVPISLMRVNPVAQKDLNQSRVDYLAANFDPEQIGTVTVNHRDGLFNILDGQHRVEALKAVGWADQQIQCWSYEGLTDQEEAETYLKLNNVAPTPAIAEYRIAITAGREKECEIDRVVRAQGLRVSTDKIDGSISAVGTLRRVYDRGGSVVLGRTLRIVRDSYGDPGLSAAVLDGLGLFCQRYGSHIDEGVTVSRLSGVMAGVNGLLGKAENIRRQTGNARGHCVAAAIVEVVNPGMPRGKKLSSWWAETEEAA